MCIIMSKPVNVAFPEEKILKNCWDNNPDMGGFMYALNGEVHIKKGYETWDDFKRALNTSRAETGDDIPYVCHFRISTQGYDTSCCQPFPLSGKMKSMRKRHTKASIGVAHNGILDITSDGSKDYSDTMKFITDYLVNIIRGFDWYNDTRNVKLIENLISGSRFAILDCKGHCEHLGKGWVMDKGIHYSNSSYSYEKPAYTASGKWWDYDDYDYDYGGSYIWKQGKAKNTEDAVAVPVNQQTEIYDPWEDFINPDTGEYNFDSDGLGIICPYTMEDDDSYCGMCSKKGNCPYVLNCQKACGFNGYGAII